MHFHNDIQSLGSRGSSLHNVTETAARGWQPLFTFLPHMGNGSPETCYDLDTHPETEMRTNNIAAGSAYTVFNFTTNFCVNLYILAFDLRF